MEQNTKDGRRRKWVSYVFFLFIFGILAQASSQISFDGASVNIYITELFNGSTWNSSGGYVYPSDANDGVKVPPLANLACIGTDSSGIFQAGTCSGSGGAIWTFQNMTNYGVINSSNNTWVQNIKVNNATWASNASGIACSLINGGSDTDFCADATTAGGGTSYNNENWTQSYNLENASRYGNTNFTQNLSGYLGSFFNNQNWSVLYVAESLTRWNTANTTAREASYFLNSNWTTLYNLEALTRWNTANTTAREASYWNYANNGSIQNSTINAALGRKLENITDFDLHNGEIDNLTIKGNMSATKGNFSTIDVTGENVTIAGIFFFTYNSSCRGSRYLDGGADLSCRP